MSCNGCRVLRKGCSDDCMLRQCLKWIDNPKAQSHATLFVAKFFGRACLMSFISSVPEHHRSALFHSLLFEAVGRTVNPVNGVVGLLWTGNWQVCRAAVDMVLRGGVLQALPEFLGRQVTMPELDNASKAGNHCVSAQEPCLGSKKRASDNVENLQPLDLNLSLTSGLQRTEVGGRRRSKRAATHLRRSLK
ncbi:LOB domain-containing protein 38-like [Fagus crenata]